MPRPGEMAIIKIKPKLYGITPGALARFSYLDRKCVAPQDGVRLNVSELNIQDYTEVNCFVAAAYEEIQRNCNDSSNLKCFLEHMRQVGRWKFDRGSQKQCLPSCERYHHPVKTLLTESKAYDHNLFIYFQGKKMTLTLASLHFQRLILRPARSL